MSLTCRHKGSSTICAVEDFVFPRVIDNNKKMQSMEQQSEVPKTQHSLINSILPSASKKKKNKKNVFDEDIEEKKDLQSHLSFTIGQEDHDTFQKVTKNNTDKPLKKSKIDGEQQSLPEVSSERYYQTTKTLDIGKGSDFSLRTLFQQSSHAEQEYESSDLLPKLFTQKEPKIVFQPEVVSNVEQQGYWKNAGMWTEPLFFLAGDNRLKEATDFIHQPAKEEAYRDRNKWFEQREKLKQYYRNKMRRNALWVAGTAQQPQKKRLLVDGTDESSFQYFGQQDEIERQKKKKPHRTFFK